MRKIISVFIVLCMLLTSFSLMVLATDDLWGNWTLTGGPVIRDGKIHVISTNTTTATARLNRTKNTKFDLEVEFSVKEYGTAGGFQILTGSNRAMMYVYENRIEYRAADYNVTKKMSSIPYDIGYEKHKYRVVGNGENCDLFIDDYFVADFTIESNTSSACIYFWTASAANKTSELIVTNYVDRSVSASSSVSSNEKKEIDTEPKAFRYDFEDGEDISNWSLGGTWEVKDGYLQNKNTTTSSHLAQRITAFADDYVFEMRARWLEYGTNSGITIRDGEHEVLLHPHQHVLQSRNRLGLVAKTSIDLGNDWHDIRIETYNNSSDVMVFLDNELIHESTTSDRIEVEKFIALSVTGTDGDAAWMQVDWLSFEPINNSEFGIKSPMQFAQYLEGQKINLSANIKDAENIPYIEYKINGKTVARGEAPEYDAVIENMKKGNYTVTAEYGDKKSVGVSFNVLPAVIGEISFLDKNTVSLTCYDKYNSIKNVEYFIDGMSIGGSNKSPYTIKLPLLSSESHMLTALCYDAQGDIVSEIAKKINFSSWNDNVSVNYANNVVYTVAGKKGSAELNLSNGNHKLLLTHNTDSVSYYTNEGIKTYGAGLGNWQILTDAYTAEVYFNGQFAFSFVMPKTDDTACTVTENGLSINDLNVSVPDSRGNYFVKRNVTDKNSIYNLSNLGSYHNLDFVAGINDSAMLAVSDGYFRTSIEIKDGKIYTFTTDTDSSVPYRTELASISETADDIYYRVETAAGMSRLYADGKWIASFRSVHSTGKGSVGINIVGGDGLKYVAVSDNADLYMYQDDFNGKAEFDSIDYWRQENVLCYVDKTGGIMTLNAQDEKKAISEIHVSTQEAEVSAEIEIKECAGGFWFIFNHGAENIYSKAGYNFETGSFEITNNLVNDVETVSVAGDLPIGRKVNMSLKVHNTDGGKEAVLYVDGNAVITHNDTLENRGRIGFIIDNGVAYIHNFSYSGDSKPVLCVKEKLIDNTAATYDMYEIGDQLVLMNAGRKIRSNDGFNTWTVETTFGNPLTSDNIVRLKSGALISISRIAIDGGHILQSSISYDDGLTWEKQSNVMDTPRQGRITMNNRIIQGKSGRLYLASGEDNNEAYGEDRLYYSDDDGWTWTPSEVSLNPDTTGWSVQESKIIELSNGEVRMYFRNESGMLMYCVSHDRGATWDLTPRKTPFFSTLNCFNIEYDPYEENVLYIVWGYDNAFADGRNQSRRTRIGMARSYDDGDTWEYLGTVFEFDMNTFYILKGNDYTMMNACVNVGKDYVVVNAYGRHDLSTSWTNRVIVLDKDKLRGSGRFEQVHFFYPEFIDITRFISEQKLERTLVADKTSNRVFINGKIFENGLDGDKISALYAAAYVGADLKYTSAEDVVLSSTNTEVKFSGALAKNGEIFISVQDFAEEYALNVCEKEDIYIISEYNSWSDDQIRAFRYGLNLFSEFTGEQTAIQH